MGIEFYSDRKRPCLVIRNGNKEKKLATFIGMCEATEFIRLFAEYCGSGAADFINKTIDQMKEEGVEIE